MAITTESPEFKNFMEKLQAKIDAMDAKSTGNICGTRFAAEQGQKFIRVIAQGTIRGELGPSRSAYAFVSMENGDIFKSDSWKRPAKHARGNISDADPVGCCQRHSVIYLR